MWLTTTSLFAANTSAKQSRIRHELHSLKKGSLSIKGYVAKIKGLCALLEASGSHISEAEKIEIMFAGLPAEFDVVVSSASLSSTPFPFQRVVDALLECESRQAREVQELLFVTNMVENVSSQLVKGVTRGGRPPSRGSRGRSFRPRLQC